MPQAEPSRLAHYMAYVALIAAIALPALTVILWSFWDKLAVLPAQGLAQIYDPTLMGLPARLAGFAVFFLAALIQAYGLLGLRETFLEGAAGTPLSARAVNGFRRFAWVCLIMVFVGMVQHTVLVLLLSVSDPSQMGALSIQFGSKEFGGLFIALMLIFVAQVFSVGQRAADENQAFV